jgi:hypothetical protein
VIGDIALSADISATGWHISTLLMSQKCNRVQDDGVLPLDIVPAADAIAAAIDTDALAMCASTFATLPRACSASRLSAFQPCCVC